MKLGEILEHISKDILNDRTEMLRGTSDSLWSDALLVRLLNHAQKVLARSLVIRDDATSGASIVATQIQLVQGQSQYNLHPSVLRVITAKMSDSEVELQKVNHILSNPQPWSDEGTNMSVSMAYIEAEGRPTVFSSDEATRKLRVRVKPNAASALLKLNLQVARMPIEELDLVNLEASPEVPEEYHLELVNYVAGECLSMPNVDSVHRESAADYKRSWASIVRQAQRDMRALAAGSNRVRYGGWARDGAE